MHPHLPRKQTLKKILLAATAMVLLVGMVPAAHAQVPAGGTSAPAPAMATPSVAAPSATSGTMAPSTMMAPKVRKHAKRVTLQQHFEAANTTHDGHLTKDQATAAKWTYVNKHFDVMDTSHKGFVTVSDIHAFSSTARAARAQQKATPVTTAPAAGSTN